MTQQNTAKKPSTKTVTKPVNKVNVVRISQVMQDGSINLNDADAQIVASIKSIVPEMNACERLVDRTAQSTQLFYGCMLNKLFNIEAQYTDKKGVFGKPKRISYNDYNKLIVATFGQEWTDKHKNQITAYRSVYEFMTQENFSDWIKDGGFYDQTGLAPSYNNNPIKFFDTHEVDITNFQDEKTGQYHSVKTLYTKFGFKVNKDGEPEKRVPNTSANGANKRKEEKPTSDKQKVELTLQSVKAFLNANGMQATDRMEAITLFGNVLDRLAQHEAKKAK